MLCSGMRISGTLGGKASGAFAAFEAVDVHTIGLRDRNTVARAFEKVDQLNATPPISRNTNELDPRSWLHAGVREVGAERDEGTHGIHVFKHEQSPRHDLATGSGRKECRKCSRFIFHDPRNISQARSGEQAINGRHLKHLSNLKVSDGVAMPADVADASEPSHIHTVNDRQVLGARDDDVDVEKQPSHDQRPKEPKLEITTHTR